MTNNKQDVQLMLEEERKGEERGFPWDLLLKEDKVIKDSVHKDVWLTKTEVEIIDSEDFQRLRYIRQLGTAFLLYPGAQHTRFDHSLGTLHVAQKIIDAINKSAERGGDCENLSPQDIFTIRIVALLHDLAHLPYGHILEDEGELFKKKQWADEDRIKKFLWDNSKIPRIIQRNIKEAFEEYDRRDWKKDFGTVMEDIRNALSAKEPEHLFADIVGNTVCADLLDYLKRDVYFTGIYGEYDERLISYFTLKRLGDKRRVVIRLFKGENFRHDILSALLNLLELRYSLAEKVYYHHTRREASAMIIGTVASAMKAGILDKNKLLELNDDSLLFYIISARGDGLNNDKKHHLRIAKELAMKFMRRQLYKPIYEMEMKEMRAKGPIEELRGDWEKRYETERELEWVVGLEDGSILIYIPHEAMGAKKYWGARVELPREWGTDIKSIEELKERDFPEEYREIHEVIEMTKHTITRKHEILWKLSVLIRDDVEENTKNNVRSICEQWFRGGIPVSMVEFTARRLGIGSGNYTEIAEGISKSEAVPPLGGGEKSSFAMAVEKAKSLLEGQRNE